MQCAQIQHNLSQAVGSQTGTATHFSQSCNCNATNIKQANRANEKTSEQGRKKKNYFHLCKSIWYFVVAKCALNSATQFTVCMCNFQSIEKRKARKKLSKRKKKHLQSNATIFVLSSFCSFDHFCVRENWLHGEHSIKFRLFFFFISTRTEHGKNTRLINNLIKATPSDRNQEKFYFFLRRSRTIFLPEKIKKCK